jgi:hypothetical protein
VISLVVTAHSVIVLSKLHITGKLSCKVLSSSLLNVARINGDARRCQRVMHPARYAAPALPVLWPCEREVNGIPLISSSACRAQIYMLWRLRYTQREHAQ